MDEVSGNNCNEDNARMLAADQFVLSLSAADPEKAQEHRKIADGLLFAADAMAFLQWVEGQTQLHLKGRPQTLETSTELIQRILRGASKLKA